MHILFDIDGVLADCTHRLRFIQQDPKDWDSFFSEYNVWRDTPIPAGIDLLKTFRRHDFTLVTGRPERNRSITLRWLGTNGISIGWDDLVMRIDGDHRPAHEVKKDLIQHLKPELAVDDDPEICRMYVDLGFPAMLFMSRHSTLWHTAVNRYQQGEEKADGKMGQESEISGRSSEHRSRDFGCTGEACADEQSSRGVCSDERGDGGILERGKEEAGGA